MILATFDVVGVPAKKGSFRGFVVGGTRNEFGQVVGGSVRVIHDSRKRRRKDGSMPEDPNPLKRWAGQVSDAALLAYREPATALPVAVDVVFRLPRPGYHFNAKREIREKFFDDRPMVAKRDDLDKFLRAALDCLSGIVWLDDSQVCAVSAVKEYANGEPGALFLISELRRRRRGGPPRSGIAS